MKIVAIGILTALMLVAPVAAGTPAPRNHATGVRLVSGPRPISARTPRAIPSAANTVVNFSFNGQPPQAVWTDSPLQLEAGWHGVLVIVSGQRHAAPATVRVLSARADHVAVYVRFSWR